MEISTSSNLTEPIEHDEDRGGTLDKSPICCTVRLAGDAHDRHQLDDDIVEEEQIRVAGTPTEAFKTESLSDTRTDYPTTTVKAESCSSIPRIDNPDKFADGSEPDRTQEVIEWTNADDSQPDRTQATSGRTNCMCHRQLEHPIPKDPPPPYSYYIQNTNNAVDQSCLPCKVRNDGSFRHIDKIRVTVLEHNYLES